jgi:hypothetical protein
MEWLDNLVTIGKIPTTGGSTVLHAVDEVVPVSIVENVDRRIDIKGKGREIAAADALMTIIDITNGILVSHSAVVLD